MYKGIILVCAIAAIAACSSPKPAGVIRQEKSNLSVNKSSTQSYSRTSLRKVGDVVIDLNQIIDELNFARTRPKEYAKLIEATLDNYQEDGRYHEVETETYYWSKEGPAAALEAIDFLNKIPVSPPVEYLNALALSAGDHIKDLGPKGKDGHYGTNGSTPLDRIQRYGVFPGEGHVGESIAFGYRTPRTIIIALLVDDGVKDRSHRRSIMNPKYTNVGTAFGYHKRYGYICVMDFAKGLVEKSGIPIASAEVE